MNQDALAKVVAMAGGSTLGALLGNAVVPDSTLVPALGSGVVAGLVKQNWSRMQASDSATSKDGSLMTFFKFPYACAARIGLITALINWLAPMGGTVKEKLAIAAWFGGASEVFVVDPANL